jgi:hypothetical protein
MLLNIQKVKILEEFLPDYTTKVTGSQIAKKKGINQKSVSNFLKELQEEHLMRSVQQGKNKLYCLNLDDELILRSFLSCCEQTRTIHFYQSRPLVKEVMGKVLPFCQGVVALFGSYAKGTETQDSDMDLLIIGKHDKEGIQKASRPYRIEINIKHYPKVPEKSDPLLREILKDHILLGQAETFVEMVLKWRKSDGALP